MLTAHTANGSAFWIDLHNPTPEEIAQVAAEYEIDVPSRESLQEIETSSRLRADGQVLYASMPLAIQDQAAGFAPVPLGFVLSPEFLITIRFSEVHAFAVVEEQIKKGRHGSGVAAFRALIEGMVDAGADRF